MQKAYPYHSIIVLLLVLITLSLLLGALATSASRLHNSSVNPSFGTWNLMQPNDPRPWPCPGSATADC